MVKDLRFARRPQGHAEIDLIWVLRKEVEMGT